MFPAKAGIQGLSYTRWLEATGFPPSRETQEVWDSGVCDNEYTLEIGDSHLFTSFSCLGFLFLGPADWQGAQSATKLAFELSEE